MPALDPAKEDEYIEKIKQWYDKHGFIVLDSRKEMPKGYILKHHWLYHFLLRRLVKEGSWRFTGEIATLAERRAFTKFVSGLEPEALEDFICYKLEAMPD